MKGQPHNATSGGSSVRRSAVAIVEEWDNRRWSPAQSVVVGMTSPIGHRMASANETLASVDGTKRTRSPAAREMRQRAEVSSIRSSNRACNEVAGGDWRQRWDKDKRR
ncbi:Uncharacterized protein Fot_31147 [Forsythia ovata]|uniref:Uncharacterized protein n=1 Tax=Forsythia ovata TaxID=205694 RepID=A0ABD1T4E5_9LAMI